MQGGGVQGGDVEGGDVQAENRPEPRVASFHLVREPAWHAPVALARLGTDRLRLRGTPGLRFARLLGTGSGAAVSTNPEPRSVPAPAVMRSSPVPRLRTGTSPVAGRSVTASRFAAANATRGWALSASASATTHRKDRVVVSPLVTCSAIFCSGLVAPLETRIR